jgi:hypothetical protein
VAFLLGKTPMSVEPSRYTCRRTALVAPVELSTVVSVEQIENGSR